MNWSNIVCFCALVCMYVCMLVFFLRLSTVFLCKSMSVHPILLTSCFLSLLSLFSLFACPPSILSAMQFFLKTITILYIHIWYISRPIFTINFWLKVCVSVCVCVAHSLTSHFYHRNLNFFYKWNFFYLKEHVKTLFINLCFVGKLTYNCFSALSISD